MFLAPGRPGVSVHDRCELRRRGLVPPAAAAAAAAAAAYPGGGDVHHDLLESGGLLGLALSM